MLSRTLAADRMLSPICDSFPLFTRMKPVCFVTERLFPADSIDDWALEVSWRARELSRQGTTVVILWVTTGKASPAVLECSRQYYAAMGVTLRVKEDLAPFL